MENHEEKEDILPLDEETQKDTYIPRPRWQIWAARIGLVIMILAVISYYWQIANGGI